MTFPKLEIYTFIDRCIMVYVCYPSVVIR